MPPTRSSQLTNTGLGIPLLLQQTVNKYALQLGKTSPYPSRLQMHKPPWHQPGCKGGQGHITWAYPARWTWTSTRGPISHPVFPALQTTFCKPVPCHPGLWRIFRFLWCTTGPKACDVRMALHVAPWPLPHTLREREAVMITVVFILRCCSQTTKLLRIIKFW